MLGGIIADNTALERVGSVLHPDCFYRSELELFGRERVEGWSTFGDDAALWGAEARQSA